MKSNISEDTLATDKTRESIIAAAEKLIRRHGPAKTKIVDVARHLGMSHANVYRHFENKAGIENVVAERWLENIIEPLNSILKGRGLASNRIRKWIFKLIEIKLRSFEDDPELFATYHSLAEGSREVIKEHVMHLREQLATIIHDGVENGEFQVKNIDVAARAVYEAITRFQHPYFVAEPERRSDASKPVVDLLVAGLEKGVV